MVIKDLLTYLQSPSDLQNTLFCSSQRIKRWCQSVQCSSILRGNTRLSRSQIFPCAYSMLLVLHQIVADHAGHQRRMPSFSVHATNCVLHIEAFLFLDKLHKV